MPPKRKAPASGKGKAGGKKARVETQSDTKTATASTAAKDNTTGKKAIAGTTTGKKVVYKPDEHLIYYLKDFSKVVDDYHCMLNQTNIDKNNNKFYLMQVLEFQGKYYCFKRWGRVGEDGDAAMVGPTYMAAARREFEKKFRAKTGNSWWERESFVCIPGKYTIIDVAVDVIDDVDAGQPVVNPSGTTKACTLDAATMELVKTIFDVNMFNDTLKEFNIDVKKMPLGALSKAQIAKGLDCLDKLEVAIKDEDKKNINSLTSTFYTTIPHTFGRKKPPPITDLETVQEKKDMLLVLSDIQLAQTLQIDQDKNKASKKKGSAEHPLDAKYNNLNCKLELLDSSSREYKLIETYAISTQRFYIKPTILHVWKVDRDGEKKRFSAHDAIASRKLLWHGTSNAVIAAILKSGLRIMPHSGGRLGKGIYFSSALGKSAHYVGFRGSRGIMFLNEVALGKEWTCKNSRLFVKAPNGYDCVVGRSTEPDPKEDTTLTLDGKKVTVPQGRLTTVPEGKRSSFTHGSEYVIYKESQNRIRYMVSMVTDSK